MNIGRLLSNTARRLPDRPAVSHGAATRTWSELDRRADALAHALAEVGVRRNDRVGMYLSNRPELLETMFACFKAGYCLVPLNRKCTQDEIDYHLSDSSAAALVTDAEPAEVRVLPTGASSGDSFEASLARHVDDGPAEVLIEAGELAWLFYTSGTTGRPKGAMLTHGNLAFVVASWLADLTPMSSEDVVLHAAPLTHGAGFHALAAVARGAHQIIPETARFAPGATIELMRRTGVTNAWMVPTQIVMLVDHLDGAPVGLPALRHLVYGGAPFAAPDLEVAVEVLGDRLVQLYAQGESPMTITFLPGAEHVAALNGDKRVLESAGYPRPGMDVAILGPDDTALPIGEVGEVAVRGPAVMCGYWGRPEATQETLRSGWLHTGDLGRMDEHGYLYLLDRAKDLIITGGSNVYPIEVERVLLEHPNVRDAAVLGLPDRTWGETVAAVVVWDGEQPAVEQVLAQHCARDLAKYKLPRRYLFVEEIERNAYGKVSKAALRTQFRATVITRETDE